MVCGTLKCTPIVHVWNVAEREMHTQAWFRSADWCNDVLAVGQVACDDLPVASVLVEPFGVLCKVQALYRLVRQSSYSALSGTGRTDVGTGHIIVMLQAHKDFRAENVPFILVSFGV